MTRLLFSKSVRRHFQRLSDRLEFLGEGKAFFKD